MSVDAAGSSSQADGVSPEAASPPADAGAPSADAPPPASLRDSAGPFSFLRLPSEVLALEDDVRAAVGAAEGAPPHTSTATDAAGRVTSRDETRRGEVDDGAGSTVVTTTARDEYQRDSQAQQSWDPSHGGSFQRSESYAEQHARGVSATHEAPDGETADAAGAAARTHVSSGKTLLDKNAQATAEVAAWQSRGRAETTGPGGTGEADYDAKALEAHAAASAGVTATTHGVDARADAHAGVAIVDATGHASYTTPPATVEGVPFDGRVDATVHATASAEAHANGDVVVDPLGGRAYAGGDVGASAVAKIDGSVTGAAQFRDADGNERSIASVTGDAYASAGAEAQAHAHFGFDRGQVSFDLGAGAAWGYGAGYGVRGQVDLDAAKDAALEGIDHATGGEVTRVEQDLAAAKSAVTAAAAAVPGGSSLLGAAKSAIGSWFS
jgi:hypothetical protein